MKLLFKIMDSILKLGAVVCVTGMIGVVILQVYARALLPQVPPWTEEVSRMLFIYTVGFAAGPAIREKAYVNVDVLLLKLSARMRTKLEMAMDIVLLAFAVVFAYESYKLLLAIGGTTTAALEWPMESFYSGIMIMSLFIMIYLTIAITNSLNELRQRKGDSAQ